MENIYIQSNEREILAGTLSPDTIVTPLWSDRNFRKTVARAAQTGREVIFWTRSAAEFWLKTHATNNL